MEKILPVLKEINPSLLESFAKTSEHLKESQQIIEDRIEKIALEVISVEQNSTKINISTFNRLCKI